MVVKEPEKELRYGWFSFRPRWLQIINNAKCFLLVVVVHSFVQGMAVNGINLPALEKRFQLTSKDLGLIAASNDISAILLVCFVSFYGQFGNKIKWLGHGAVVTGIGLFLFALPQVIISPYQPVLEGTTSRSKPVQECVIRNNTSNDDACFSGYGSSSLYLLVFCAAQMLMGAGTTPLYSLAPAYIDENVHPKSAPVYLGIFYAAAVTGPGIGYVIGGAILNDIYIQVKQPMGANLTSKDPQWIGAWWLGYLISGVLMFLAAVLILGFPRELPRSAEMREKAIQEGHLPKKDPKLKGTFRDIIPATLQLLKNPTYMFNSLALTAGSLYGGGMSAFIAKFADIKFNVNPAITGSTLGTVIVVGSAGGIVLGGILVRRFNLKKSCKLSARYCLIIQVASVWTVTALIIPGCDEVNLAGVVKPYHNSTLLSRSPVAPCNANCSCSLANINPVCGQDNLTYFSPCYAGCERVTGTKAFNCSCIARGVNNTHTTANKGYCDRGPGCKYYTYFLVVICLLLLNVFLIAIPNKTVVLRCVPDNQRSYSLGFQFIFQRALGFLPGPVLFGGMFDSLCIFWGQSCGKRGRCQLYDVWKLSLTITIFGCAVKGLSLLFYGLSFWFCKSSYEEESSPSEGDQGESGEELKCTVADQKDLGEQVNPAVNVTPGESKEELGSTVEQGAEG